MSCLRSPDGSGRREDAARAKQKREDDAEAVGVVQGEEKRSKRSKRRKTGSAGKLPKAKRVGNFRRCRRRWLAARGDTSRGLTPRM